MSVTMGDINLNNFHTVQLKDEILKELKNDLKRIKVDDNYIDENKAQDKLEQLISWMSSTPKNIVIRVNTILCEPSTVHHKINEFLKQYSRPLPNIKTFPHVEELIVINSWEGNRGSKLTAVANELIVDAACGVAVLRGAHIFAPGVLGMPRGLKIGDKVSVYADLKKNCKKGLVINYDINSKLFIGNGIVNLTRDQIFANHEKSPSGIAVLMSDTISHVPQLNEEILPKGQILLQNLPSVICSRVLNPQPRDIILDMCAAPGNKTTHISALMKNEGTVIALEKNKNKFDKLLSNINLFDAKNVKAFCFDSTQAVCESKDKPVCDGPPFSEESFDRILLDGPCSALGQRPQICNPLKLSQLRSYVPLQRKLFSAAARLLKVGGNLIYSTCTITIAENEGIVSWALKTFPNLELKSIKKNLFDLKIDGIASVGYSVDGLSIEQSNDLCRFETKNEYVGFFIACFTKKYDCL